ncbi:IS110 family transposase [Acidovorax sp. LjRoot194]|uniref:IS110 family transposase n=1 Tax=Acidovorax sp. LjRoot194 TaxID=3342280 RepID=UPI003ECCB9DD
MQVPLCFIGVDVSKAELVVATHGQDACLAVANESTAIVQWLHTLPPGALLAMESTGRFHQLLATLAAGMGLTVFVLNARDVYFYAKGLGARGKTDRVDARIIARYLAEHHERLHPHRVPSACQAELEQLLGQRWTVVTKRTALRQSLRQSLRDCSTSIAQAAAGLEDAFGTLLHTIDGRITQLIKEQEQLHRARTLLQSIVGIGPQSSALLVTVLDRVAFCSCDALVAYSGLDPRAHDSGRSRGRRHLSKRGNPALRHQMFMAAMSACHTVTFAATYQALRARGLKSTEALVVLARKLLRIAFAVWRSGKPFDAHRITPSA